MTALGELDVNEAANEAADNWQRFDSFIWDRASDLEDTDDWAIVYTHHRDSGLLDRSNAAVIERALLPFTETDDPDVVSERHTHWAVGWIDGFSIRVRNNGQVTEAFKVYHRLAAQMAEYPILDEEDYSNRELEATFDNIGEATWQLKHDFTLPEDWQSDVHHWLSDHRPHSLESSDDQGG